MPETEDYISKVHKALSENVEGFKTDTAEFREKLSKNPEYADKVYTALKENINGFDKTQQDFFDAVKKKSITPSQKLSTPSATTPSKESTTSGGFLEILSQGMNQKLQSVSGTSESAPSKSESSKTIPEHHKEFPGLFTNQKINADEQLTDVESAKERKQTISKDKELQYKQKIESNLSNNQFDRSDKELAGLQTTINSLENTIATLPGGQQSPYYPGFVKQLEDATKQAQQANGMRNAYLEHAKEYAKDLTQTTKQIYDLQHPKGDSYVEGGEKALAQATGDMLHNVQGVANFIDNSMFGGLNQKYAGGLHNAYAKLGDYIKETSDENLANAPDDVMGGVVKGVMGSIPLIAQSMVAGPEVGLGTIMGVNSFGKEYEKTPDLTKVLPEAGLEFAKGQIFHGIGVSANQVGKLAGDAATWATPLGQHIINKSTAALITSVGFGGADLAEQLLTKGSDEKIDLKSVAVNAITGGAMSLGGFADKAYEKSQNDFMTTTPEALKNAMDIEKPVNDIRDHSVRLAESIDKLSTKDEKARALLAAQATGKIANVKAFGEYILKTGGEQTIDDIKNSQIPDELKQQYIEHVQKFVAENDPRRIKSRLIGDQIKRVESRIEDNNKNNTLTDLERVELNAKHEKDIVDLTSQIGKVLSEPLKLKTDESKSKKTSEEGQKSQESGSEKGVLTTPPVEGEGSTSATETTPPASKGAAGGVLSPEIDSYVHSLPEEEMMKLEKDLKEANTSEKEQELKKQFEENSGLKITDEEFRNLGKGLSSVLHDYETTVSETIKPQENATEKGKIEQSDKSEHIGTQAQREATGPSDRNSVTQGGEEQDAKEKVRNIQSLPDEDYVKAFIDSGQLISVGTQNARFDIGHIFQGKGTIKENVEKAIASIKAGGKLTADAQRLKEVIIHTKRTGEVPMIEGSGGTSRGTGVNIPVQEFREDIIKSAPEPKPVDENAPETVLHKGERYTVERTEGDSFPKIVDSKGSEVNPNDGPSELKLYNVINKIAEVNKTESVAAAGKVIASQRAENGLDELKDTVYRGHEQVLKESDDLVKAGKVDPAFYTDSLISDPNAKIDDVGVATVLRHRMDLQKKYENIEKQINDAPAGQDLTGLIMQQTAAEVKNSVIDQMLKDKAGSTAQTLAAFNLIRQKDYTRLAINSRIRAAEVGGEPNAKTKEIIDKAIAERDAAIDLQRKLVKDLMESNRRLQETFKQADANKAIRRAKLLQEAEDRKTGRKATKEEIQAERTEIVNNLKKLSLEQRSTLSANPINAKMVAELGKLATNYVKEGIVDIAQIIDDIHLKLSEVGIVLSKDDIENSISDAMVSQAMKEARDLDLEFEKEPNVEQLQAKMERNLERSIDDYEKRLKYGDFKGNKRELKTPLNDKLKELIKTRDEVRNKFKEAKKAEAKKTIAENKIDSTIKERQRANRPALYKNLKTTLKIVRFNVLSSPTSLYKLASAALSLSFQKPITEIGKAFWHINPITREISKLAPTHGGGIDLKALGEYYKTLVTKETYKEAGRAVVGKSEWDAINKEEQFQGHFDWKKPETYLDIPGNIHGAIKTPIKLAEYQYSVKRGLEWHEQQGHDITSPEVIADVERQAVTNALSSILMNDNAVAKQWSSFTNNMTESKNEGVQVLGTFLQMTNPVIKVPLNYLHQVWQGIPVLGFIEGQRSINKALRTGEMSQAEAEKTMLNLNRQFVGAVLSVAAIAAVQQGLVHAYSDKEADDLGVKRGTIDMFGLKFAPIFQHNAAFQVAKTAIGITQGGEEKGGYEGAAIKEGQKFLEEVPFNRTAESISGILKSKSPGVKLGYFLKSLIAPGGVKYIAEKLDDEKKRSPETFYEVLMMDIPGLRQYVSESDMAEAQKRYDKRQGRLSRSSEEKRSEIKHRLDVRKSHIEADKKYKKENGLK